MYKSNNSILGRPRGMTEIAIHMMSDRIQKCEELRQKINNGDYFIEPTVLATSIVSTGDKIKRFAPEVEGPEDS